MCGIAGIVNVRGRIFKADLKKMTDVLAHRGPDGEGQWLNNTGVVGLGHRRLSIIDLSDSGAQPMHSIDGRYTIVFNGEIYNYIELREQLTKQGVSFASESDTEVLLYLFARKGQQCLEDLDGMFAFAIWDNDKKELFCARDRFGEKPFYYFHIPGEVFVFASEIKALFAFGVPKEPNERLVSQFFHSKFTVANPNNRAETFYHQVNKLPAAHYLYVQHSLMELEITKYWDINWQEQFKAINEKDVMAKFQTLFHESIKRRLRSDVPIGSSLSGGIDSSAIVCWISKYFGDAIAKQKTFSARFKGFVRDEGKFMNIIEEHTGVEAHHTWPDENMLLNEIDKLFYHQDEPFGSASIFAQWEVMKLAKSQNITVLIDGQGADEIFAGYHPYYLFYINNLYGKDSEVYKHELNAFNRLHNASFKGYIPHDFRYYLSLVKGRVLSVFKHEDGPPLTRELLEDFNPATHRLGRPRNLNEFLYQSIGYGVGLEDLLRYEDRSSMAFSVEARLPFLSHKIAELVFSLPDQFKLKDGWTKLLLRKSIEGVVPNEITWRKDKIGYEPPQSSWMEMPQVYDYVKSYESLLVKQGILKKNLNRQTTLNYAWQIIMNGKLYESY